MTRSAPPERPALGGPPPAFARACPSQDTTWKETCDLLATQGHASVYELFSSREAMYATYDPEVANIGVTPGQGSCDAAPAELEYSQGLGRVLCVVGSESGRATIMWTNDQLNVLTIAFRTDGDLATLSSWWEGPESGPGA